MFPTGSKLNQLLAVVVFASAMAVLLVLGVVLLLVVAKRRRSAATDKLRKQDIDAEEKDKSQEEYKVRAVTSAALPYLRTQNLFPKRESADTLEASGVWEMTPC